MLAGAREFLVKPFSSDELTASIRQVYARERDKAEPHAPRRRRRRAGGGRRRRRRAPASPARSSPSSARRAASAARPSRSTSPSRPPPSSARRSSLVDGSLPVRRRRRPAQPEPEEQVDRRPRPRARGRRRSSRSTRSSSTTRPASGSCSPRRPGDGRADHAGRHQAGHRGAAPRPRPRRRRLHGVFNDTTLAILDVADVILTMLTLEITSIKNMRLFLEVADQLGYEERQGPARPQPRRLGARHPRRGRRALDRPQGRRHDRQRRPERGLRAQPRRPVLPVATGRRRSPRTSSGWPRRSSASGRRSRRPATTAGKAAQKKSLFAWR